jgi:hypothetical protein
MRSGTNAVPTVIRAVIQGSTTWLTRRSPTTLSLALKLRRREMEFVRFDEETHELSRSGRPSRRLVRLYHLLRWFDRYLRPEATF